MFKYVALTVLGIVVIVATLYWLGAFDDPNAMHEVREFKGRPQDPLGVILAVAFTPDGERVVAGGNEGVWVWRTANGDVVQHFAVPPRRRSDARAPVNSLALSADGTLLLTGANNGTGAKLWRLDDGSLLHEFKTDGTIISVALSRDGRFAFAGSGRPFVETWPIRPGAAFPIYQWDLGTRNVVSRFEGHIAPVSGLAILPDEKRLLSASQDGTLRLWDMETDNELGDGEAVEPKTTASTGRPIIPILSPSHRIALSLSNNGRYAVWGSKLWNVEEWKEIANFQRRYVPNVSSDEGVLSAAFSPDDRYIVTGYTSGKVRLWDAATRTELADVYAFGDRGEVYSIAFSPDGKHVVAAGIQRSPEMFSTEWRTVRLWRLPRSLD